MVRNKFAEQMALLLSSVRVMGVNLEEALDMAICLAWTICLFLDLESRVSRVMLKYSQTTS